MQRVGGWIPNHLVDADPLNEAPFVAVRRIVTGAGKELEEEHRVAGDRLNVDWTIERNRDSRLDIEAVEHVDHVEVLAIGGTLVTRGFGRLTLSPVMCLESGR